MAITVLEKRVPSADGIHELAGRVYLPGKPVGIFQVVHGMTEHVARYDGFMRRMAEAGWICFGYDHLGHGRTAKNDGELGYLADRDGWKLLVRDVGVFAAAVRGEYGEGLPYVLLGHSMGSFVVRQAVVSGLKPDRLIVMGTGGPNPAAGAGLAVIRIVKAFRGGHHVSKTVDKLAFGSYNKRFEADGKYGWLTKVPAVREAYAADKFCTFPFTVSAMGDLVRLNAEVNKKRWFEAVDKSLPVLLVSGTDDPVGDYGRGVAAVYSGLTAAGADVRMKLYPGCRHEILNETCRDEVIADLLAFAGEA